MVVTSRDVKTVYFSEPVTSLPKTGFLPVTKRPIVSRIIVTGRSALAISRSLVASRRPWPAYQTHGTPSQQHKGQWHIKVVGAEGTDVYAAMS